MDSPVRSDKLRREPGSDRRKQHIKALLLGSFLRRRRGPRRPGDRSIAAVDWHQPHWLAVSLLILLLSVTDAFLTLTLLNLGAEEINPFMAPLVTGSGRSFALWKLGLTSTGLIFLTIMARMRTLGGFPIGGVLYVILALYSLLVGYELWLVEHLTTTLDL